MIDAEDAFSRPLQDVLHVSLYVQTHLERLQCYTPELHLGLTRLVLERQELGL